MSNHRVNRGIELLAGDQPIYYTGGHTGALLTHEQGVQDARTWADYINVGMEHGCFDLAGLAHYMAGLVEGGPTASGHRTPTVIVEAPVDGTTEPWSAITLGSFARYWRAARTAFCCVRRKRPTPYAPSWNRAATRAT